MKGLLKPRDLFIIYAVWLIVQVVLFAAFGVNDGSDAQRFIGLSGEIVRGHWDLGWNDLFYFGYVAGHALLRLVGLPPKSMYVVQLLLSAVAVHYFLRTLSLWVRSGPVLVIAGVLYAGCFATQRWVSILLTDSIFFDLLTIATYYFLAEQAGGRRISWVFILLLPFFRPTGILFPVFAAVCWLFTAPRSWKLLFLAGVLVLLGCWVFLALTRGRDFFYPYHNLEANVICGISSGLLEYQRTPYREGMGVMGYLWANPGMSMRLFTYRLLEVFTMTRPYFSPVHNWIVRGSAFLYYIPALVGVTGLIIEKNRIVWYLVAGMVIFCVPSVIFCVDWSGRFSLPVFCFLFLLMGSGLDVFWRRISGGK